MAETASTRGPGRVYLVDGSGYIFRAFHALPMMTRHDGTPVNAIYGFVQMILKLMDEAEGSPVAVIFDAEARTFRSDVYAEYKAHRPEAPEELVPQFPMFREVTRAFNLPCIEVSGYEADDLIATYARIARKQGLEVIIVSSDKDLMQLIRPGVWMYDPMRNRAIDAEAVVEKFGVGPEKVVEVQALAGDSIDNVPGVPGIGVKTAAQLINEYGDLETLLGRAGEIKQPKRRQNLIENAELARISHRLVVLKDDVPLEDGLESLEAGEFNLETLVPWLIEQCFDQILNRLRSRFSGEAKRAFDSILLRKLRELPTAVLTKYFTGYTIPGILKDEALRNDPELAPDLHAFLDVLPREHGGEAVAEGGPARTRYDLVQDLASFEAWLEEARRTGIIAIHTEAADLGATASRLAGIALATEPGRACYVPLAHRSGAAQATLDLGDGGGDAPPQIATADALAGLKPLLEDGSVLKVGHDVKRALLALTREYARHFQGSTIEARAIDDAMLMSFVLDGGRHGHGLSELVHRTFEHAMIRAKEIVGSGKSQIPFAAVELDRARAYATEIADFQLRLNRSLRSRLVTESMTTVYETIERPLVAVIAAMERAGMLVDRAELDRLGLDFSVRARELERAAHALAGEEFNIGSPKQLGEILFDKLGIQGGRRGKTGAYGTGAEVLEELAAQGHELPRVVLDWRQLAKLKSTYTDALVDQIDPETGRIHTTYSMAVAQTGRLSSNDPNLQNIPVRTEEGRKIRRAFVAAEGCRIVSLDYSQIELRIVAHVARINALIEAFQEGLDIHALTASQVFDTPVEGMDPLLRRRAKAINFGIIYGISAFGLARNLGISRGEAQEYIDAYFARYPGIRVYVDETIDHARKRGYVTTLFGRKIHLMAINDRNPSHRGFAERQAINAPIQGTAADIIKRAMIRVPSALERAGLDARMLLQVHDELLFEAPAPQVQHTIEVVRDVMEGATRPAADLSIPLVADAGSGHSWDEAH